MTNTQIVYDSLIKAFPDALVIVKDPRGDDQHLAVSIVSEAFRHKTRVQCHQMVYQALYDLMDSKLHALSIETGIPS